MRKALLVAFVLALAAPASALAEDAKTFDLICHMRVHELVGGERRTYEAHISIDIPHAKFCFKRPNGGGCGYVYPITGLSPARIDYFYDPDAEGPDHAAGFFRGDNDLSFTPQHEHIVIRPDWRTVDDDFSFSVGDAVGIENHEISHGDCAVAPFSGVDGEVYFSPFPSWKDPKNRPFKPKT
jgi:hypothetical protein